MSDPKDYDAEAARLAANAYFASLLDVGSDGGAPVFRPTPTADELREADEAPARAAAEQARATRVASANDLLDARIRMLEREIASGRKKLEKKIRKASR